MLDAALEYAARGWAVFPLVERDKVPKVAGGFKVATTDAEQIRAMWERFPQCNVGIATGSMSGGLVVIDLDVDDERGKDGNAVLRAWEREHGELPETVCAVTGGGGEHLVFRSSEPVRCAVGEGEFEGVDVRADGGYIVAPPSVHPSGRRYEWEVAPDDVPVAQADGNVLALAKAVRLSQSGGRDGERVKKVNVNKKVEKGGRNNALFKALCSARSAGFEDMAMEAFAKTYNEMNLVPPLSAEEVGKTLESVLRYDPGNQDIEKSIREERKREKDGEKAEKSQKAPAFHHNLCARELIANHGACFIDGAPAVIRDGRYRIGWGEIDRAIIMMRDDAKAQQRKETKLYLEAIAPRVSAAPPNLIGFENGVLDVETMAFREWRDTDVIPNVIPHRWNAFAECPAVDIALRDFSNGDPGMELNLHEVAGLCMYRSPKYGYAPVLTGKGSNGKSTYISMLRALLGTENTSSLDLEVIGKNFQAQQVAGKLANLGDDISNEFLRGSELSVFKKLTTGSRIYSDVKNNSGFEFDPYCTLVFSANEFPRLGDSGFGVMRRLFPIEFGRTFSRTDPGFDPDIAEKLSTEEAIERFARLAVSGLRRIIETGTMTPNRQSERSREEIRLDNDTVLLWMSETGTEESDIEGEVVANVYEQYAEWCRKSGAMAVKINKFSRTIAGTLELNSVPEWVDYAGGTKKKARVYRRNSSNA